MTNTEKQNYKKMRDIGYYAYNSYGHGLLYKATEYGINDYAIVVEYYGNCETVHRVKVDTTFDDNGGRLYIRINGKRYYLNDFLAV